MIYGHGNTIHGYDCKTGTTVCMDCRDAARKDQTELAKVAIDLEVVVQKVKKILGV